MHYTPFRSLLYFELQRHSLVRSRVAGQLSKMLPPEPELLGAPVIDWSY